MSPTLSYTVTMSAGASTTLNNITFSRIQGQSEFYPRHLHFLCMVMVWFDIRTFSDWQKDQIVVGLVSGGADGVNYKKYRNLVTNTIARKKKKHFSDLVNTSKSCSTIWDALNIGKTNKKSAATSETNLSSDDLSYHFSTVAEN